MERVLTWEACWNVRDLGGLRTPNGVTRFGSVVRSGNLSRLTEAGRCALLEHGIRTVIDLRDPHEFSIDLDPFHEIGRWAGQLAYVSEPIIGPAEWAALSTPVEPDRRHVVTLDLSRANIGRIFRAIANAGAGGVVIHCHAGKDRTGLIAALILSLVGVADNDIVADFVETDVHLASVYKEWASRESDLAKRARLMEQFVCRPAQMQAALDHVRRSGGIESYLDASGVSAAEITALRARLLTP